MLTSKVFFILDESKTEKPGLLAKVVYSSDFIGIILEAGHLNLTPFLSDLATVTTRRPDGTVRVGNGKRLRVTAVGTVHLRVRTSTGQETVVLTNVLVVPQLACRLFSSSWGWRRDSVATHLNDEQRLSLLLAERSNRAVQASDEGEQAFQD